MKGIILSPLVLVSVVVTALLALVGGRVERWTALLFAALMFGTPLFQHQWPWAVPLSSIIVTSLLLWWALTHDRWWLVFAAGCQMLALATHVVVLVRMEDLMWSAVTVRWLSWCAMLVIAVFGAWEGWALERLRRRANVQPS